MRGHVHHRGAQDRRAERRRRALRSKRRSVFKALTRRRAGRWTTRGHRERAARRRPRRRVRARRARVDGSPASPRGDA